MDKVGVTASCFHPWLIRLTVVNLACVAPALTNRPASNGSWIALALFNTWFFFELVMQMRIASSSGAEEDFRSRAMLTAARDASLLLPAWVIGRVPIVSDLYLVKWGIGLFVAGLITRLWAMRTLGRYFTMTLTNQTDHVLITHGLYRWIRHPGYLGLLLIYGSFSLVYGSLLVCACVTMISLVAVTYRVNLEDRLLMRTFGTQYLDYQRRTGAFLPRIFRTRTRN